MAIDYLEKVTDILDKATYALHLKNNVNECISFIEDSYDLLFNVSGFSKSNNRTYREAAKAHFRESSDLLYLVNYDFHAFLIPRGSENVLRNLHSKDMLKK